jgi:hypothetical protein
MEAVLSFAPKGRRETQWVDEPARDPELTIPALIWNALGINFVLVSALLAAGMIFAIDLAMAAIVALGLSLLTWACAALVLIPVWLISLRRRLRQDAAADSLHDSWLDE